MGEKNVFVSIIGRIHKKMLLPILLFPKISFCKRALSGTQVNLEIKAIPTRADIKVKLLD